ncbi:MAG: PD-(D/E)XK nuclease family protein, partial [Polyangiaceae bacterium]|nr:PD-(D/E)XK nuclease family protein [Polyangiaceae bacterium]
TNLNALNSSLGDLFGGADRHMSEWCTPISSALLAFYDHAPLDSEDPKDRGTIAAATAVRDVLQDLACAPSDLAGPVAAATAVQIVLDSVLQSTFPEPAGRAAIELLGWLELAQDDAPVVVLTGFNDGFVPGSVNEDAFLPNSMRRHLGLPDNSQRYARDAFYLSALVASRDVVKVVCARRSQQSDPLKPSRLWLCGNPETVAIRVLEFYDRGKGAVPILEGGIRPGMQSPCLPIPPPLPLVKPVEKLSVTAFAAYLACPYRFYLSQILHLRSVDDSADEMSPMSFGSLAHAVLAEFGSGPVATSSDDKAILEFLSKHLDIHADRMFGLHALPAVYLQIEQLRARFGGFARWQAKWAASGKRIVHTERAYSDGAGIIVVDGVPFEIVGRIDRIDRDDVTGDIYVFDYKLSKEAKTPAQDHVRKGEWKNLQLPLYRKLVSDIAGDSVVRLGYICLSEAAEVKEALAKWTEEQLAEAYSTAENVIRGIRNERFWPPSSRVEFDDFPSICQALRLGGPVHREVLP